MSLYHELNRRNVFRVGAAYVVVAWLIMQVAETIFPLFGFNDTPARIVVVVLAIGFIPSVIIAWVFELTPEGLKKDKAVQLVGFVLIWMAIALFSWDLFARRRMQPVNGRVSALEPPGKRLARMERHKFGPTQSHSFRHRIRLTL